jgi:3-dehydrosphinganine reductase
MRRVGDEEMRRGATANAERRTLNGARQRAWVHSKAMKHTPFTPGKVVVITGGSSGLGLALAGRIAACGAAVVLVARREAPLAAAAEAVRARVPGARVETLACDVADAEAVRAAFGGLAARLGRIDAVIHSAGILREGAFDGFDAGVFDEVMAINFNGAVHVARAALPHLMATRGRLVNIASAGGLTAAYGYAAYCASKYALVGFSEVLRFEQRPAGVTVQLVCPPEFDSPMVDAIEAGRSPENRAHVRTIPKQPLEVIAAETLRGIARGDFLIVPGRATRVAVRAAQLFPGLGRWLGDWRIRRARGR